MSWPIVYILQSWEMLTLDPMVTPPRLSMKHHLLMVVLLPMRDFLRSKNLTNP